ncbi:hypothetical protein MJO28_010503 [Puccinia striiformis f. sp. tritici]|uniref:Uncharacterized protein n=1 Tax=Puccinia striiformis f. sp. tritici TaxID=168172 RepID=A0ACC0E6M6_9BASI|nr:hypothetical protein MJO28_010503 [Puccinia striiformis f. sp. tritici]
MKSQRTQSSTNPNKPTPPSVRDFSLQTTLRLLHFQITPNPVDQPQDDLMYSTSETLSRTETAWTIGTTHNQTPHADHFGSINDNDHNNNYNQLYLQPKQNSGHYNSPEAFDHPVHHWSPSGLDPNQNSTPYYNDANTFNQDDGALASSAQHADPASLVTTPASLRATTPRPSESSPTLAPPPKARKTKLTPEQRTANEELANAKRADKLEAQGSKTVAQQLKRTDKAASVKSETAAACVVSPNGVP